VARLDRAQWSELTRPYGDVAPARVSRRISRSFQALHRLVRYGHRGDFAVSASRQRLGPLARTAHRSHRRSRSRRATWRSRSSSSAPPVSRCRQRTRGPLDRVAFIPGVNLFAVNVIVTQRLGGQHFDAWVPSRLDGALVVQFHSDCGCASRRGRRGRQSQWIAPDRPLLISSRPRRAPLLEVTRDALAFGTRQSKEIPMYEWTEEQQASSTSFAGSSTRNSPAAR